MTNYTAPTFHPETGAIEEAEHLDNHFGHYQYGVRFADGRVFRAHECEAVGPKAMAKIERLQRAADIACSRGCSDCADTIREARALLKPAVCNTGESDG